MNEKTDTQPTASSADSGSNPDAPDDRDARARPGGAPSRTRQQAVMDLFAGKATIDQIARRLGDHASTVEGWRQDAMDGVAEALRRGSGKTPAELRFERKNQELEQVVTKLSIQKRLLENALETERCAPPYRAREVQAITRQTVAGDASVSPLCETLGLSRAAYYAEGERQRRASTPDDAGVVRLPSRPGHTRAEVVLMRIREVLARETSRAWGVRKVWATLRRDGLRVSRRRVHALMRAHGLVLVRDRESGCKEAG